MNKLLALVLETTGEYCRKPKLEFYQSNPYEFLLASKLRMNARECGLSSKECKSILSKFDKIDKDLRNLYINLNKLAELDKWDAYLKVMEIEFELRNKIVELEDKTRKSWYNSKQLRLFV